MNIAPNPLYPERAAQWYQAQMGPNLPGNKGPLRFEEGVATDTDVPNDFARGAYYDTTFSPTRVNHNNREMVFKYPEETMAARAHVGSSTWILAPMMLGDFVDGTQGGYGPPQFERVFNPEFRQYRRAATVVHD